MEAVGVIGVILWVFDCNELGREVGFYDKKLS